jgi:hypothetical protein
MNNDTRTASQQITDAVTAWPEVSAGLGSRGEYGFRVAGREIGHLHGDHAAHFAFSRDLWHELHAEGRIDYHPVFPGKPGMAARRIEQQSDVDDVIALLRLNYERAVADRGLAPTG